MNGLVMSSRPLTTMAVGPRTHVSSKECEVSEAIDDLEFIKTLFPQAFKNMYRESSLVESHAI